MLMDSDLFFLKFDIELISGNDKTDIQLSYNPIILFISFFNFQFDMFGKDIKE